MNSHITAEFRELFNKLPERVKKTSKRNFKIWKENPDHPGIQFKKIDPNQPIFSVRVGIGWRAVGVIEKESNTIIWFWIGSHADYEKLIRSL